MVLDEDLRLGVEGRRVDDEGQDDGVTGTVGAHGASGRDRGGYFEAGETGESRGDSQGFHGRSLFQKSSVARLSGNIADAPLALSQSTPNAPGVSPEGG